MARSRFELTPSLIASALVHVGVAVAILLYWPKSVPQRVTIGNVVPVNIVANGPVTDIRPAEQAPVVQSAQTETPVPEAPVQPVAPVPAPIPQPTPAAPKPALKPTPQPPPKPAPGKAKPQPDFFASLEASLGSTKKAGGATASSGPKGPNRAETDLQARKRVGAGKDLTATEMADLAGPLFRTWNPNCEVEGGGAVDLTIEVTIGSNGYFVGEPRVIKGGSDDSMTRAAAARALSALKRVEPYKVPSQFQQITVPFHFNPRDFCAHKR